MRKVSKILRLNGKRQTVSAPAGRRVLDVLRNDLGLVGSKEGCGEGECGACTIIMDGDPAVSCLLAFGQLADGVEIMTIEGVIRSKIGRMLKQAYMETGAVQCGFCIPGMVISSYALLKQNPNPGEKAIRTALAGNLCRCTGYKKIVAAVKLAAKRLAADKK